MIIRDGCTSWECSTKFIVKPRNIKAFFPLPVDGKLSGGTDDGGPPYAGIKRSAAAHCTYGVDLVLEDVAKLLDNLFRGDRRIGNDEELSKKVVLMDENEMTAVMMGFPNLKCLSRRDTGGVRVRCF